MQPRTRTEQRRIDTLCGYALACYGCVTLTWVVLLIEPGLALYTVLMAMAAGGFGLMRGLLMPPRFWVIQAFTLAYVIAIYPLRGFPAELAGIGMLYTAGLGYSLFKIMRNDFAKHTPDWLCEHCGYPLVGLTENICPECGKPFNIDRVPLVSKQTNQ